MITKQMFVIGAAFACPLVLALAQDTADIGAAGADLNISETAMAKGIQENMSLIKRPKEIAKASEQAYQILGRLTNEEKFSLVCGNGLSTIAISRLGIPAIRFTDASAGVRINPGDKRIKKTTAFPSTQLLAAAWNPKLAYEYGKAVAEECRGTGNHVLLGPGVNIYRTSANGRNFEYLGEDPYLASRTVEAYIHGVQDVGVLATVKHFVCNNSDYKRRSMNAVVDERTLHEIYTPAFKAAIDAGVWSVMTSYNLVNGEWMGQNKEMMTMLRRDLGFPWMVMTDWTSTWYADKLVDSGVDLDMPGGAVLKMEKDKWLGSPGIDRMAHTILKTFIASGVFELEATKKFADSKLLKFEEHAALSKMVNDEGIVLLKNNGVLPIKQGQSPHILVTGKCMQSKELSGKGSAHVLGYDLVSYADEAQKRFGAENVHINPVPTDDEIKAASAVLIFPGFNYEGEDSNRKFVVPDNALIERSAKLNPHTVVLLVSGGGVAMDWADNVAAILFMSFGGQKGAQSAFDVLSGEVVPSGKLPFSIEKRIEDSVACEDDKVKPNGDTLFSPLFAKRKSSFHFDEAAGGIHTYDVAYTEGVFTGYRGYDAKNIDVRYPFGHGLSYTKFDYSNLRLIPAGRGLQVEFNIKNSGSVAGAEVAQVYVGDLDCSVPRPPKELKGYTKTALQPGESRAIKVNLPEAAFKFWNPATKNWMLEPGKFKIFVGSSSRDIRLTSEVVVSGR